MLEHPWIAAAVSDLQIAIPGIELRISTSPYGPLLTSNARWSDAGEWQSAQPWRLPINQFGIYSVRCRTPSHLEQPQNERTAVRQHIKRVTQVLRTTLQRHSNSELFARLEQRAHIDPFAKTAVLYEKLCNPGPPLHTALDWVGPRCHRAAIAGFFAGEFFLGRYAGNFFAKPLLPTGRRHLSELAAADLQPSRVCLHCWHLHRQSHLEDERHVLFICPAYAGPRNDFLSEASAELTIELSDSPQPAAMFKSHNHLDWAALGRYLARIRQIRRRIKIEMQRRCEMRARLDIAVMRRQWKREGKSICRHGVFFATPHISTCPCLQPPLEADWSTARMMPVPHEDLKCITVDTFEQWSFRRLGVIQAELRRRRWF